MNDLTKIIPRAYNFFCEIKPFLNYSILNLNDKENYCVTIDDDFLNEDNGFKENFLEDKLKKYIDEYVVPDLELHVDFALYKVGYYKDFNPLIEETKETLKKTFEEQNKKNDKKFKDYDTQFQKYDIKIKDKFKEYDRKFKEYDRKFKDVREYQEAAEKTLEELNGIRAQIFTFVGTIISAIAVLGIDIKFSASMFENFVRLNSGGFVLIYFFGSQGIFIFVLGGLIWLILNKFNKKDEKGSKDLKDSNGSKDLK
jgi:hypothetical protein